MAGRETCQPWASFPRIAYKSAVPVHPTGRSAARVGPAPGAHSTAAAGAASMWLWAARGARTAVPKGAACGIVGLREGPRSARRRDRRWVRPCHRDRGWLAFRPGDGQRRRELSAALRSADGVREPAGFAAAISAYAKLRGPARPPSS